MFCILKTRKYILPTFQNITQSAKNKFFFNDSKQRRVAFYCCKKLSVLLRGTKPKNNFNFYCLNCLHLFKIKDKFESHKKVCENEDF